MRMMKFCLHIYMLSKCCNTPYAQWTVDVVKHYGCKISRTSYLAYIVVPNKYHSVYNHITLIRSNKYTKPFARLHIIKEKLKQVSTVQCFRDFSASTQKCAWTMIQLLKYRFYTFHKSCNEVKNKYNKGLHITPLSNNIRIY